MSRARRWAASGTASARARAPIASSARPIRQEARERVYEPLSREFGLRKDHSAPRGLDEPALAVCSSPLAPGSGMKTAGTPRLQHSVTVPAPLRPTSSAAAA